MDKEYLEGYIRRKIKKRAMAHMITENNLQIAEAEKKIKSLNEENRRCRERISTIETDTSVIAEKIYTALGGIEKSELRDVIELKYINGMTIEEISEIYRVEPRTVHRWHKKALEILLRA